MSPAVSVCIALSTLGAPDVPEGPPPELIALRVGRAVPVAGEPVEDAVVLVEGGRIVAFGPDVDVPLDAQVLDFPDSVAVPGLVLAHSTTGLRVPNERMSDVPFVSVLDGIDPSSRGLENARRDGVTTVHVVPSSVTRIGGQAAVIRSVGRTVDELVVQPSSAIKISLDPPRGETRMGNMAALRERFWKLWELLQEIQENAERGEDGGSGDGEDGGDEGEDQDDGDGDRESDADEGGGDDGPRPLAVPDDAERALRALLELRPRWGEIRWDAIEEEDVPERERPLVELVRGELRTLIDCSRAADVYRAFELIEAHGLDATLVLGADAWKVADVLAARDGLGPVIVDPRLEVWEEDPETGDQVRRSAPRALHRAGVRFALQPREDASFQRGPAFSRDGAYHLWHQAARLVALGVPRAEALRSITLTPAEVLGLDHRIGSIEKGKDANIAVFSGDPLDARSWVQVVLVEGRVAYRRTEDSDLELLLRRPHRPF